MSTFPLFIPIHSLLADRSNQDWINIWGTDEGVCSTFQDYCFALTHALSQNPGQRIILGPLDRVHFLACFLAGIHCGKEIIVPHSSTPGLLEDLLKGDDLFLDNPLKFLDNHPIEPSPTPFCAQLGSVALYTSGSTGQPKIIKKKIKQLDAEIAALDRLWGKQDNQPHFYSTVPHHHIYGLLFSLLWPACAGYRINNETSPFWEDIMERDPHEAYLISSPAHIGRLPSMDVQGKPFSVIFSSGALLPYDQARTIENYFSITPIEVFGSTETGGIAYRQQWEENQAWMPFPQIDISQDNQDCLQIRSPYLPDGEVYQTQDQIKMVDEKRFHLIGRADRIVKIEGKRVSLPEMEQRLGALIDILEAYTLALESGNRTEIGVVATLTSCGKETLEKLGKKTFVKQVRDTLSHYFEPVTLPRKWRFVDEIPQDARGKRPLSQIKDLFEMQPSSLPKEVLLPDVLIKEGSTEEIALTLYIPENLHYFKGHFPNFPIVPGVTQLHWAVHYAKEIFGISGKILGTSQIKFSQLIKPKDHITLILTHNQENHLISYQFKGEKGLYSSGRFTYAP